jgi:hypothetical protein
VTATAWLRALRHTVTVRRNTTSVSSSGSTKFVYSVVATGVKCALQDGGGRMSQADVGQDPKRKKRALFAPAYMGVLQQNDVLLITAGAEVGSSYKIMHLHDVPDPNAPHVEADVEQVESAGGD